MPRSPVRGFTLSGSNVPNSFSVGDFGVAVNAKYDRFGCGPRTRVMYSAGSSSSSIGAALTPSACLSRAAASPPCEECASSMITAYRLLAQPRVGDLVEHVRVHLQRADDDLRRGVFERLRELSGVHVDLLHHARACGRTGRWSAAAAGRAPPGR